MEKIYKDIMSNKTRGMVSLDALILFIAIVIVVAVTSIILINTGSSLQQKILTKTVEGKKQVTSGFEVINIIGTDASSSGGSPHHIEDVFIMIRLLPGSLHHPLNTTLLVFDDGTNQFIIQYNTSCASECESSSTMTYNVFYINTGKGWEAGHINHGDIAKIAFKPPTPIKEETDYIISIHPTHGPRTQIEIVTPQMMMGQRITLWPIA